MSLPHRPGLRARTSAIPRSIARASDVAAASSAPVPPRARLLERVTSPPRSFEASSSTPFLSPDRLLDRATSTRLRSRLRSSAPFLSRDRLLDRATFPERCFELTDVRVVSHPAIDCSTARCSAPLGSAHRRPRRFSPLDRLLDCAMFCAASFGFSELGSGSAPRSIARPRDLPSASFGCPPPRLRSATNFSAPSRLLGFV